MRTIRLSKIDLSTRNIIIKRFVPLLIGRLTHGRKREKQWDCVDEETFEFHEGKRLHLWGIGMLNYFQLLAKMPIFFRYVGLMT
jgi:hypothetical protein